MEKIKISDEELKKELPKGGNLPPLDLLPDREWLEAKIIDVVYQIAYFNNKPVTVKDAEGGEILDANGNPIYRREFNIVFALKHYQLSNGHPRQCWLRLGASLGKKANLPKFLINVLGDPIPMTPETIITMLKDLDVKLQLANNKTDKGTYQNVVWDAVKKI